jgi:hypothetical protein
MGEDWPFDLGTLAMEVVTLCPGTWDAGRIPQTASSGGGRAQLPGTGNTAAAAAHQVHPATLPWPFAMRLSAPGYVSLAALLERLFGKPVAAAFCASFALGDASAVRALCADAGIADATVVQRQGTVRFASIDALVSTQSACVWTLGGLLNDAEFDRLRREAQSTLLPFVDAGGMVAFQMPALLITAAKR